jgi:signal transduction histidine kinase
MKSNSLIRRAISAVLLLELLCALVFVWTALWHERRIRLRAMDVALEGRADALIGAIRDAEDPEDNVTVDPAEFEPPRTDVFAVYSAAGKLVGTSANPPTPVVSRVRDGFRYDRAGNHTYRVFQREALRIIDREKAGGTGLRRPVTVVYAIRSDHLWHEVMEAASFYVGMSLGLLLVTALALIVLLRKLLDPIQELAIEAAEINPNSPSFSPPPSAMRVKELAPLAEALASAIARLLTAFEGQHRFIADAAHELKTAVAVVRSTVQVIAMRTRTPDEYRRGLDDVLTDTERVEALISRMLTLARFEEIAESVPEQIDLSEHVGRALKKLASYAEARGVVLRSSLEKGVRVSLESEAAEILASNLIMNAIQHSRVGGDVIVSVRTEGGGARKAMLVVQDFGSGIAPENLTKVFDRFFREDASRSRETGGFGLGLSICKSIVETAHGEIQVQSVLGQGTVVKACFGLN